MQKELQNRQIAEFALSTTYSGILIQHIFSKNIYSKKMFLKCNDNVSGKCFWLATDFEPVSYYIKAHAFYASEFLLEERTPPIKDGFNLFAASIICCGVG